MFILLCLQSNRRGQYQQRLRLVKKASTLLASHGPITCPIRFPGLMTNHSAERSIISECIRVRSIIRLHEPVTCSQTSLVCLAEGGASLQAHLCSKWILVKIQSQALLKSHHIVKKEILTM